MGNGLRRLLIAIMSALPPKADIHRRERHVRFVPKADIGTEPRHVRFVPIAAHNVKTVLHSAYENVFR
jgi:hypothetical protein